MLGRKQEQGSIAVAMIILMVLTGLSIAGLARTLTVLKATRASQSYAANLAWADSALSDVLYRLDQNDPGSSPGHVLSRTTAKYTYTATPVESYFPPDHYTVLAKGTGAGNAAHGIKATLRRRRRFGYGIYTVTNLDLSGGAAAIIHGTTQSDGSYTPAIIGSSGTITLPANGAGGGDGQDYFFPSGQCVRCYSTSTYRSPDAQHLAADEAPIVTPVTMPTGSTNCSFSGTIADGSYLCSGDLTFTANTTVSQTGAGVTIFVPANKSLKFNQKSINYGGGCTTAGNASLLQIYMVGGSSSTIDIGSGGSACVSAIIYAPTTSFLPQGQGMTFTGSMFLYSITGNGDPTGFNFYYDRNTASVTRDWRTLDYQEIPASQVP
jgi:hypothetical protein